MPGRLRRAISGAAKVVGLGAAFVLAAAGAVHLHLGLSAPRRFAAAAVNGLLAETFQGKILVHRIGALDLTRLTDVDAEVLDPEGNRALLVYGAGARLGTFTLLRSVVSGSRMKVDIPDLDIRGVEVVIQDDEAGELSLARAFEPKQADTTAEEPSSGTEVHISDIDVGHVWVHGRTSAAPLIDADLDDIAGSFSSTPDSTDIHVKRLRVRGRGLQGMNPEGRVEATASLPAGSEPERTRVSARYEGQVGDIPVRLDGAMNGKRVDAVVEVLTTMPAAIEAIAPGKVKLGAPVTARAEVHGDLPVLRPDLRATIGEGEITATATVTLPDEAAVGPARTDTAASARVTITDIDLSELSEGAPESRLTAVIDTQVVSRPGGRLEGTFQLENRPGEVAGEVVPAATAQGEFTERSVIGSAQIAERGAPTSVAFSLQPKGDAESPAELDFEVETTIARLDAVKRIGRVGRGSARVTVTGEMDLDTRRLSASAEGRLSGLDVQGVRLASGFITGSVTGSLDSPRFRASVRGAGLQAGGVAFESVRASASGSPEEIDVSAMLSGDEESPDVEARAHITSRADVLTVSRGVVEMKRADVETRTDIGLVRVAGGAVDIRGVKVQGLGEPLEASARIAPGGVRVKAKTAGIDLSRVSQFLGGELDTVGYVTLDVDARTRGRDVEGRVDAEARLFSLRRLARGATVQVSAALEKSRLHGHVLAGIAETGDVEIFAREVALGGPALEPTSWRTATGNVAIDGVLALERVLSLFPEDERPLDKASGTVTLHGSASRSPGDDTPTLDLEASTHELVLVAKQEKHRNPDGTISIGPTPWSTAGLDGAVSLKLEGSGHTDVSVKLHDKLGPLVAAAASAKLPVADIVKAPDTVLRLVQSTPVKAKIEVPRRSLDAFPVALGPIPVKGEVELTAAVEGTAQAPKLELAAKGTHLVSRRAAHCVRGVDVQASVTYDGEKADVDVTASRDARRFLATDATVKVNAAQALAGGPVAWEASADATLSGMPLDVTSGFLDRPVSGSVSGKVALRDLHRAASLEADLDLARLALDRATFPKGKVTVTVKDGALTATARLDQTDGYMETTARGAMTWGAAIAPDLDLAKAVDIGIRAKAFRANAAMPFVNAIFSELDGRIDTDAKIHIEPGAKDGHMNGAVAIRDGVIEVPQIGERFHGVTGKVIIKPWGTVRFDDFTAKGPTGTLHAKGNAVLDGFALRTAHAEVRIPEGQSVPITVEGVPMGRAYGTITTAAKASEDGKRIDVNVDIPVLHVELPQSTGHSVQPLDPDPTVRIGHHVGNDFALLPLKRPEKPREPSDTHIVANIKLGQDVEVKRDTTVHVVAHGNTRVEVTDKARVTGLIRLDRGKVEVQGKMFHIDHGTVSFVGDDPANPTIVATAYWDAPDATRVFIDFSGRASSGKLTLRSDPELTQDEILSLILFGSRDGSFGAEAPPGRETSTGARAVGMAGGVVTQGVNKAISGITSADITTRVDTSDSSNPRPELAVQVSKDVSVRLGYKLGVPAPGDNPDRTELTVEWRFIRNWSLVTVVGDQGSTSLDLVWRLRY